MTEHLPIVLLGISHKTAPVETREVVAFSMDEQEEVIENMISEFRTDGCMVLSTCNRTELYLSYSDKVDMERIRVWLDNKKRCSFFSNKNVTYEKWGTEAVEHYFKVISGLDSQIVGEQQITTQVKESYNLAHSLNATDSILNRMFNFAMQVKKQIHHDTFLSDGTVSVSFAGVELARKIFSDLQQKSILLIGAGKTAELAAYHFKENNVKQINVVNRTVSKAEELADKFNGRAFGMEALSEALEYADIVISATSGTSFIITPDVIQPIARKRNFRPMFLIDLAIPRDIDPAINDVSGIFLYNLDDLQEIVSLNLKKREKEIPKSLKIVHEYILEFRKWVSTHSITFVISKLKERMDRIRLNEIERLKKNLPQNGYMEEIDHLTQSIINKLIRQHVKALKKSVGDPEKYQEQVELIFSLYELDDE